MEDNERDIAIDIRKEIRKEKELLKQSKELQESVPDITTPESFDKEDTSSGQSGKEATPVKEPKEVKEPVKTPSTPSEHLTHKSPAKSPMGIPQFSSPMAVGNLEIPTLALKQDKLRAIFAKIDAENQASVRT
jgi:hypothetical protein